MRTSSYDGLGVIELPIPETGAGSRTGIGEQRSYKSSRSTIVQKLYREKLTQPPVTSISNASSREVSERMSQSVSGESSARSNTVVHSVKSL